MMMLPIRVRQSAHATRSGVRIRSSYTSRARSLVVTSDADALSLRQSVLSVSVCFI